jgi:DnaJ-class molecular chaperone
MEDDAFIECPVCKGEGVDLEGYICWKCEGERQIRHESYSSSMEDDAFIECPVCKEEGVDLEGYICWKCEGHGRIRREI